MIATDLERSAFLALQEIDPHIRREQGRGSRGQVEHVLELCKDVLKGEKQGVDPETQSKALVFGVLFRGLLDFIDLSETTHPANWITKPELVEKAWVQMWDSRDRLEYASHFCHHEVLDYVLSRTRSLEKAIFDAFGPGLYSSPEILVKRELCSVCKNDFRTCDHLIGNVYDGVRCASIPENIELRSVSIVSSPKDPRCRIWPWQLTEDGIIKTCILTTFHLEDFMDD